MKKRIIATILSIALMITSVPWTALDVFAQTTLDVVENSKVADPDTTGDWVNYFGDAGSKVSTEYAGGVWTDKSVFKENMTLDGVSFSTGDDNFLVATSAISSTKQINGFEYLPTDTVFVLDVSGSMGPGELQDMVEAANKAITKLLNLNRYNRIGVVAYNPDVATLLTIDKYTSSKIADNGTPNDNKDDYGIFIEYSNGQLRTARTNVQKSITLNANWQTIVDMYTGNNWGGGGNSYNSAKNFFRTNDAVWAEVQKGISANDTFTRDDWRDFVNDADTGNGWNEINSETEWLTYFRGNSTITTYTEEFNVTGSDGVQEKSTKSTGDGTFTQLGIYQARTLFEAMEGDTTIDTGLIQGGTKRMPIMVLMTDGAPTYGKSDYTFTGSTARDMGNGSDVTYGLAFTTQLTATHALTRMEQVYDREGLFYTLGLGVEETEAASVLDPANNTTNIAELKGYWDSYDNPGANQFIFNYTTRSGYGGSYNTAVYRKETSYEPVAGAVSVKEMKANFPYADKYFPATNSSGLVSAFDKIVQEIIIQSAYYPTLVTTGQYDMDGYVTIVDELGEYMEVKEIEGLLYGNHLYTGAKLIAGMYNGTYGNASRWTELGWELVYSIKERLDVATTGDNTDDDTTDEDNEYGTAIPVTNDVVISLLSQAWQDGQISGVYDDNNTSDKTDDTATNFSNYVSYYVNAKGQYLGFHDKDHTETDYPKGTKYIGRSYIFSGNITGEHSSIEDTEMMHIVVQVYEDITNGHQTVTWRVPAALIPAVMYEIEVEGNQLTSESITSVKYTGETPIRLVYEVGLNDVLTPININEVLTAEGAHAHPAGDGRYYFYSNRWGEGHGVTELDPNKHKATVAHYAPSVENERYYFTEDTVLYIKSGDTYVPYTGAARPADMYPNDNTQSGYYRPVHIVESTVDSTGKTPDGAKPTVTTSYVAVAAAVLSNENMTKQATDGTNNWYVAKGTIYQQTARDRVYKDNPATPETKDGNFTGTLEYVDYPVIDHPTNNPKDYEVFLFHGNNGRLTVEPTTGLKLTKDVDITSAESGAKELFKFVVELSEASTSLKITDADYNNYTAVGNITGLDAKYEYLLSDNDKTITLLLADGETVYITGLKGTTTYKVTEDTSYNEYYVIKSVAAETVADNTASGTLETTKIDEVAFVNTAASFKGNLQITKTVTHPYGDDYKIPSDKVFDMAVTLKNKDGSLITNFAGLTIAGTENNGQAISGFPARTEADEQNNVSFTLKLAHEDSVTITGLPHGATYTVKEGTLSTGFANVSTGLNQDGALEGTIVSDQTAYAHLVNKYEPIKYPESTDFDLVITKLLEGENNDGDSLTWEDLPAGSKFEFLLEKYEPTTGDWVDTGRKLEILRDEQTLTSSTGEETRDGSVDPVTFSYLGTHYYRVSEKSGNIDGITYDATHAYFRVIVTDKDMDGYPEYTVEKANNTELNVIKNAAGDITGYEILAQFTNRYHSTVANINIKKHLTNTSGKDIDMSRFTFVLCESAQCTGDDNCTLKASHIAVSPNINGDVIIPKAYTISVFNNLADGTYTQQTSTTTTTDPAAGWNIDIVAGKATQVVTTVETKTTTVPKTFYLRESTQNGITGMDYDGSVYKVVINVVKTDTTTSVVTKTADILEKTQTAAETTQTTVETTTTEQNVSEENNQTTEQNTAETDIQPAPQAEPTYEVDESSIVTSSPVVTSSTELSNNVVVTQLVDIDGNVIAEGSQTAVTTDTVTFSNTYEYETTTATISGTKTFNRKIVPDAFKFYLYETDSTFAVAANAQPIRTAATDNEVEVDATSKVATDEFSFAEISYDKAGTYHYVAREFIPAKATAENNYTVDGVTYDVTEYHITVVIDMRDDTNSNNKDELYAVVTVNQVGGSGNKVAFTNSYSTKGTSTALQINKALTGRTLIKDEFEFSLYETDSTFAVADSAAALQTSKNSAYNSVSGNKYTGTVQFAELTYERDGKYYYVIRENIPADADKKGGVSYTTDEIHVTVDVVDDGKGTLKVNSVTYTPDATLENSYTPAPTSVTINGVKYYASNNPYAAKDVGNNVFEFALYPANEKYELTSQTAVKTVAGTKRSGETGYVDFALTLGEYTAPGDYYYVLREIDGGVPTISYDLTVYHLNVTVTDNGLGQLSAVPHIYLDGKGVENKNDNGTFDIVRDPLTNWDFQNLYYPQQARAGVQVTKVVTNPAGAQLDKEGYEFALYRNATDNIQDRDNYVAKSVTDKDGNAYLEITYDDTIPPDTYPYYLAEVIPEDAVIAKDENGAEDPRYYVLNGMKYSTDVYVVNIKVYWDDNGLLKATVAEEFNKYGTTEKVTSPITITNIYDLGEAKLSLTAEKVLKDRNLKDNEFSFALYNATVDEAGNWVKGDIVDTETNSGKDITFAEQTYTAVGSYHYIIEEVIPEDSAKLNGVTYDTTQYKVTVYVTDNGEGSLEAAVVEINGNAPSDTNKVVFTNDFDPVPIEIVIEGVKKLNNRAPLDGEFSFALYVANANYKITDDTPIATVSNTADGTFRFTNNDLRTGYKDFFIFEETATEYFVVKEIVPEDVDKDPTIKYSTFEHNIEVDVTKRDDGQLTYTVTDESGTSEDLIVENTYTPKRATATVNLSKTFTNETGANPGIKVKDFTFGLYTNAECTVPYTRNGNHVTVSPDDETGNFDTAVINIPYTDASYTTATEYTYYLKEIIPEAAHRVPMLRYDNSVYKVVVTLSYDKNNDNKLVATPVITKIKDANGNPVEQIVEVAAFDNVYDLGTASITLEGTKVYEGWSRDDQKFTFELYQTGASGNYAATGSQLLGTAKVNKANPVFTFTSVTPAASSDNVTVTDKLSFTKTGTYYFAVRENKGGLTDLTEEIIYSGTQYVVAVKVSENIVNDRVTGLKAEKVVYHYGNKPEGLDEAESFAGFTSDNIRFTNLDLDGKATIDLVGTKVVKDGGNSLTEDEMWEYDQAFDFVLYEAKVNGNKWTLVDSKPDTVAVDPLVSTENREIDPEGNTERVNKDYNIEFLGIPLEYEGDGSHTYHFVIKELAGSHPTITYDDTEYRITVTAAFTSADDGNGGTVHNYKVTSVVVNGRHVQFETTNEGNHVIVIVAGDATNEDYAFDNTYTPIETETGAVINVEKLISNRTGYSLANEEFEFVLYTKDGATEKPVKLKKVAGENGAPDKYFVTEDGTEDAVITIKGAGTASIELHYTDKDVSVNPYVYYIEEVEGNRPGMNYSDLVYRVEVTVAFDTTGTTPKLVATPVIYTVDAASGASSHTIVNKAEFTNTYSLAPATFEGIIGTKVIEDRYANSYDFRFELYRAVGDPSNNNRPAEDVWTKGQRIEEVANAYQTAGAPDYNQFRFSDIVFDRAGDYFLILVEQPGVIGGVTYDETAYQITVNVAPMDVDSGKAELAAKVTGITKVTYSDDSQGNKVAVLTPVQSLTAAEFEFTNIYNTKGVLNLSGTKEIVNRGWRSGDEFVFELYETDSNWNITDGATPVASKILTADSVDSAFSLEAVIEGITVVDKKPQTDTHFFVLKEQSGTDKSMEYDTTQYRIRVETTDDLKGNLKVEIKEITKVNTAAAITETVTADEIEFINTFKTVPVQVTLEGTKELTGSVTGRQIKNNEFEFELYTADSSYATIEVVDTVKNSGGSFRFASDALRFTAAGDYYFVIREKLGNSAIVSYDTTEHKVKVKVVEDDNAATSGKVELKATAYYVNGATETPVTAELLKFSNKYNDMNLEIAIHKNLTVTGDIQHTLGGFEFQLKDVTNNVTFNKSVSDNAGKGGYVIPYDEEDIGKVYEYELVEINKGERDMVYDTTVHKFKVEVLADNGKLIAKVTHNDAPVSKAEVYFNNTYNGNTPKPDSPKDPGRIVNTGDTTNNTPYIALMAASAACLLAVLFIMKKKKEEDEETED